MHATVGDKIVVHGPHLGDPDRDAEILEVHGEDGSPPYVVRWADDGHIAVYVPGSDAHVEHLHHDGPGQSDPPPKPADPIRLDIVEGIAAVRADVARLRAALRHAGDAGTDLRTLATAELARAVAKVECEATVLWAEVRAAQADSADAVGAALDDAASAIRTVLDDLRLQANLGGAEADAAWRRAAAAVGRLRDDPGATVEAARAAATDILARLRAVVG